MRGPSLSGRRGVRLGYRESAPAGGGAVGAVDGFNATTTLPPPPVIDFDFEQLRHHDALDSITSHVEAIAEEEGLTLPTEDRPTRGNDEGAAMRARAAASSKPSTLRQMAGEIAAIALLSLRGMLLDPIMSLVDTACVGQVSTTAVSRASLAHLAFRRRRLGAEPPAPRDKKLALANTLARNRTRASIRFRCRPPWASSKRAGEGRRGKMVAPHGAARGAAPHRFAACGRRAPADVVGTGRGRGRAQSSWTV